MESKRQPNENETENPGRRKTTKALLGNFYERPKAHCLYTGSLYSNDLARWRTKNKPGPWL